jgi:hypothetical protein
MNEVRQTFVHSIINSAVIVRELFVAVSNAKLVESPNKPAIERLAKSRSWRKFPAGCVLA